MPAYHLIITGRVQGVGFRDFTARLAAAHALSGWVRNRGDGSVEVVIPGDPTAVHVALNALHEGPPLARVERIVKTGTEEEPDGFAVLPTAQATS